MMHDVAVRYEGKTVLDKFSMDVDEGRCAGIIGVNGAGKSTLLRVLLNLEPFDGGSFTLLGLQCKPVSRARRLPARVASKVGYVSQQAAFDDEMSAWDNLAFAGQLHHLHGVVLHDRIRNVLALVNLARDGGTAAGKLSGGMKRRLSIARALLPNPDLLVLDEPTANLDPRARHEIWDIVDHLKKDARKTILVSTNDMAEARRLCDEIFLLQDGRCTIRGNPLYLVKSMGFTVVELQISDAGMPFKEETIEKIKTVLDPSCKIYPGYAEIRVFIPAGLPVADKIISQCKQVPERFDLVVARNPTLEDFFLKEAGIAFGQQSGITVGRLKQLFEPHLGGGFA